MKFAHDSANHTKRLPKPLNLLKRGKRVETFLDYALWHSIFTHQAESHASFYLVFIGEVIMLITNKKIAIIGGGPGGLTLATLLQKSGADVKVYERDINKDVRPPGG